VQVLYYDAPGSFVETGRRSASNSSLQEGWASWASADFDNMTSVLCLSRLVQSRSMRVGADVWNGESLPVLQATFDRGLSRHISRSWSGWAQTFGMVSLPVLQATFDRELSRHFAGLAGQDTAGREACRVWHITRAGQLTGQGRKQACRVVSVMYRLLHNNED
jgi:hypothetical protein